MDTEQFVEAVEEMPVEEVKENFEALFCLALAIEEAEEEAG